MLRQAMVTAARGLRVSDALVPSATRTGVATRGFATRKMNKAEKERQEGETLHTLGGRGSDGTRARARGRMPPQKASEVLIDPESLPNWEVLEGTLSKPRSSDTMKIPREFEDYEQIADGLVGAYYAIDCKALDDQMFYDAFKEGKSIQSLATEHGVSMATVRGLIQLKAMELEHVKKGWALHRNLADCVKDHVNYKYSKAKGEDYIQRQTEARNAEMEEEEAARHGTDIPVETVEEIAQNDGMGPTQNPDIVEERAPVLSFEEAYPQPDDKRDIPLALTNGKLIYIDRSKSQLDRPWEERVIRVREKDGTYRDGTLEERADFVREIKSKRRKYDFRYGGTKKWDDVRRGLRDISVPFLTVDSPPPGMNEAIVLSDVAMYREYNKVKMARRKRDRETAKQRQMAKERREAGLARVAHNLDGEPKKKYYQRRLNRRWGRWKRMVTAGAGRGGEDASTLNPEDTIQAVNAAVDSAAAATTESGDTPASA